jgi:cell division protein FtsA
MVSASRPLLKKVVMLKDIHELTKQVEIDHNSHKREILHIIPISYSVDSRIKLNNPLDLNGDQVGGEFFVIDAEKSYLRDIVDICNKSGLHVVKLFSEPLASSSVTLSSDLKAIGCTVLDIGGGTSDGLVYVNGQPIHLYTVNIAGKMMTNDLSIGLGISIRDAETLKLHLGSDLEYFPAELQDIFGKTKTITRSDALRILGPRIYELALLVGKEISPFKNYLKGGIVLTGGASNINGIIEIFTNFLGIPVSRIDPELKLFADPNGLPVSPRPRYTGPMATTLGLIDLEIDRLQQSFVNKRSSRQLGYFGTLINWLKELY